MINRMMNWWHNAEDQARQLAWLKSDLERYVVTVADLATDVRDLRLQQQALGETLGYTYFPKHILEKKGEWVPLAQEKKE